MIRIPGEVDKYIMDGKIDKIVLEKKGKVSSISMDKLNTNKRNDTSYSSKGEQPFDDVLKEEIKKISSKK